MSKKEDTKLPKIQTYVLKVHIHCDGCNKKVKKLLRKIDGVYTTSIDAEQGKVTVSGTVDSAILIKKLAKAGKHAELLLPKGGNSVNNTKPQQKENGKPQKGGGGGGPAAKDPKGQLQQQQMELLQQLKGFKDLKLPQLKDQKNVKFALPLEDGSDFDDELDGDYDDEDDEGFDDIDGFEDDLDADPKQTKQDFDFLLKGGSAAAGGAGKKGSGGGGVDIPVHFTGGGKKGDKGGGGGGGGNKDAKNDGKSSKGGDKGGNNGNPNKVMGMQGAAVQGLPAAAPTGMLPPAAAANAYQQQQYMAAMMQQRAMMNGEYGGYPQMGYMRVAPATPPPPGEPIGNYYYSDENTSWCSIM